MHGAGQPGQPRRSTRRRGSTWWSAALVASAVAVAGCAPASDAAPASTTRTLTLVTGEAARPIPGDTDATSASGVPALPPGVNVGADLAYNANGALDVYRAAAPAGPLVVLIPGRNSDKRVYRVLAGELAAAGAVVVVANYRSRDLPPAPQTDLRCVIAAAQAGAAAWGADPARLVLVGVTWGAVPAIGEALDGPWKAYAAPVDCRADTTRTGPAPRGVVGLLGLYDYYDSGGEQSDAYRTFSPFSQASSAAKVPVRLLQGQPDEVTVTPAAAERLRSALAAGGFDVSSEVLATPNLSLLGARWDAPSQSVVASAAAADRAGVDAVVRQTIALAG